MKGLMAGTRSEFLKLLTKKKYVVLLILGAAICFLRLGGTMLISAVSQGEIVIKSSLILSMLGFTTDILTPLIVFMAVTDLFASEIQEDSFKAALMRPLSRFKVMTSKVLAVFFIGALAMLIMFAASLIIQLISGGGFGGAAQGLLIYCVDIIPIFALICMALFINMAVKGPTLSMLLCIAAYIFFKYLNLYVSPLGQMIFTAYSQWHKIWIGAALPFGALMSRLGIWLGSVLILYTASYIMFEKKDF